jgi:hypothetical protein
MSTFRSIREIPGFDEEVIADRIRPSALARDKPHDSRV